MSKKTIKGAILIFSCHKHLENRLSNVRYGLPKNEYEGWQVFYFIGNPNIQERYTIDSNGGRNIITLKCEDSYLHVMKKVVMGIETIFQLFNIEEGILRCGDDLIFSEKKLTEFLNSTDKKDYMGKIANPSINETIKKKIDYFIPNYFLTRKQELKNPLNGLLQFQMEDIMKLHEVPNVKYTGGVVTYLSSKSCRMIVESMKNISFDVFKYYPSFGYPYIIEDIGIGFILNAFGIKPTMYDLYSDQEINFEFAQTQIACHTNEGK